MADRPWRKLSNKIVPLMAMVAVFAPLALLFKADSGMEEFWYPIQRAEVACEEYQETVYLMASTIPSVKTTYYLGKKTGQERTVFPECSVRVLERFPRFETTGLGGLTTEQRSVILGGGRVPSANYRMDKQELFR